MIAGNLFVRAGWRGLVDVLRRRAVDLEQLRDEVVDLRSLYAISPDGDGKAGRHGAGCLVQ